MPRALCGLLASVALWVGCGAEPPDPARPRGVVLVVVDTLRADRLGLYGHPRPTSPALDALAERAAVFERAFATSSWTLPSYGSLLTGRLPSGHGAGARTSGGGPHEFTGIAPDVGTLPEWLAQAGFATAAIVNNPFLRQRADVGRGFDEWAYVFGAYDDHPRADHLVDWALARLADHASGRFLLMVNLFDPHLPYDPGPGARGLFTAHARSERLSLPFAGLGAANRRWQPPPAERAFVEAAYDEEIRFLDAQLGRLLEAVPADVLVVVTADHGEELFEHGGFEHGHSMHEELLRVPLLFAGPGVSPGRLEGPASLVDLAPTLLEALGEPVPDGLDGRSLWREITTGEEATPAASVVAESTLHGPDRRALVRWPWKLVLTEGESPALYDLARDPGEREDRAASQPERVTRLTRELEERRAAARAGRAPAAPLELDADTRRQLEGLGYLPGPAEARP